MVVVGVDACSHTRIITYLFIRMPLTHSALALLSLTLSPHSPFVNPSITLPHSHTPSLCSPSLSHSNTHPLTQPPLSPPQQRPACNVFQNLPTAEQESCRATVIHLIINTDMAIHFQHTGALEIMADRGGVGEDAAYTRDSVMQVSGAMGAVGVWVYMWV